MFQERQLIPTAQRVPDTIQQPVEACIGWIKEHARKLLKYKKKPSYEDYKDAVVRACKALHESGFIREFWDHATKAIAVFSATQEQRVKVTLKGKERTFVGTHGGWVSKHLRG